MLIIKHRINTLKELQNTHQDQGIECDIRSEGNRLILQHDPYLAGEDFETYLKAFNHAFIIANIKSEGLETRVLELFKKYQIKNYFFLDLTFPSLNRLSQHQKEHIAIRFSEFETLEQCITLKDKATWVWIDCFTQCPLTPETHKALKQHFKLCGVSPELQGHTNNTLIKHYQQYPLDAICTKHPHLWTSSQEQSTKKQYS